MRGKDGRVKRLRAPVKKRTPSEGTRETAIVKAILSLLEVRGILAWRMPVQGVMHSQAGREVRFSRSPIAGFPDIACCIRGQLVCFEVKRPKVGRVSELQAGWLTKLEAHGAIARVVHSAGEVNEILEDLKRRANLRVIAYNTLT